MVNHQRAYELISKDYRELCEYIEAADDNLPTYSHRVYELFVRVCTEVESCCKLGLQKFGYSGNPDNWTMQDYKQLYLNSGMLHDRLRAEVGLLYWRPSYKFIQPFSGWVNNTGLAWYQDYNKVKHSRDVEFAAASFGNLTAALAGLFLLNYHLHGWGFFQPFAKVMASGTSVGGSYTCDGSIFSVKGVAAGA